MPGGRQWHRLIPQYTCTSTIEMGKLRTRVSEKGKDAFEAVIWGLLRKYARLCLRQRLCVCDSDPQGKELTVPLSDYV
jgi:hypothetical protein